MCGWKQVTSIVYPLYVVRGPQSNGSGTSLSTMCTSQFDINASFSSSLFIEENVSGPPKEVTLATHSATSKNAYLQNPETQSGISRFSPVVAEFPTHTHTHSSPCSHAQLRQLQACKHSFFFPLLRTWVSPNKHQKQNATNKYQNQQHIRIACNDNNNILNNHSRRPDCGRVYPEEVVLAKEFFVVVVLAIALDAGREIGGC